MSDQDGRSGNATVVRFALTCGMVVSVLLFFLYLGYVLAALVGILVAALVLYGGYILVLGDVAMTPARRRLFWGFAVSSVIVYCVVVWAVLYFKLLEP